MSDHRDPGPHGPESEEPDPGAANRGLPAGVGRNGAVLGSGAGAGGGGAPEDIDGDGANLQPKAPDNAPPDEPSNHNSR